MKVLAGAGAQIDTTTANGRLVFGIFAALAEFEAELIRERTKAGLMAARARGRLGRTPPQNDGNDAQNGHDSDGRSFEPSQGSRSPVRDNHVHVVCLRQRRRLAERARAASGLIVQQWNNDEILDERASGQNRRFLFKCPRWSIIEGYSRKILAGMVSPHQDLTAVLQILYAALSEYGCPQALVSDNGSVFTAGDYLALLHALEIEPLHIEKGKPWQNLIEAQFKVQLRLADFKFEQAQTLGEVQNQHAAFIETFNTTAHWAHRQRDDGARTPIDVLGWLRGRRVEPKQLQELFGRTGFLRTVNRYGFVSVQRFYLYAEDGLSRQRVSIWIYEGELSIEYQQTLLARYRCAYDPQHRQLQDVRAPTFYATPFASPQLELIELDKAQWIKFQRRPARHYSRRIAMLPPQLPLIDVGTSALVRLALKAI